MIKKTHSPFIAVLLLTTLVLVSCKSGKPATTSTNKGTEPAKDKGLSSEDQAKFAFYFVEGCKERMGGNIEKAEFDFKQCLSIDPSSSAVKYELGNINRFNGLYDNALKFAKECASEDPKNEWYQLLYIECLHNKRQFAQAAEVYARLIKNYPARPDFYEGLAAEYMYGGNYEKSYKTYDELEKKFGQNEAFSLNKIKLLKQLKKTNEAEEELKKLIKSKPEEARYYTYLAEFYQENNLNDKAMDTYQEILKIDPKNPMVHLALADYYKSVNNRAEFYKEIRIAFENPELDVETKTKILASYYELSEENAEFKAQGYELCKITNEIHPSSAAAHSIYGDFLYRDGKLKEAQAEYMLAVKCDKGIYNIWFQLMKVEAELGDYSLLEAHSAEAMELFPTQPHTYFFNGLANISLKKYEKAVESLNDGLEFVYNDKILLTGFYTNIADAYNTLKDYEKSDKAFDNALKVEPDNVEVLNNYAYYLSLRKQNLDKAEKFSRRSNELSPNNRNYIDTYGWILYQLGKYREAEEWLSRALKIGKSAVIMEHYGDVLYKLDRKDEALNYWKQAKETGPASELLDKKIADKKLYE